ncbi:MAG: DUF92 domain-containing protein [Lewinellaceae bacterium]|nr:DUF92 domain-containing protein [Lewinellaceae bacterium]
MPFSDPLFWALPALAFAATTAVALGHLDYRGAVAGYLASLSVFLGGGLPILILLGVFFVTGSFATALNTRKKAALGVAQENKGRRSVANVLANGGVAAVIGLVSWGWPEQSHCLQYMMAASLASATSDTLSSEMGNIYGSSYWRILSFQPGVRGEDGVISPEGTAFGLLGSVIIAIVFALMSGWGAMVFGIGAAGFMGNLVDSILGGSLQQRGYLDNHGVNLVSTLSAAAFMGGYCLYL